MLWFKELIIGRVEKENRNYLVSKYFLRVNCVRVCSISYERREYKKEKIFDLRSLSFSWGGGEVFILSFSRCRNYTR